MIRSSLHPAPALVLALAIGGSLTYLWSAPEDSTHAASREADAAQPPAPSAENGATDAKAEQDAESDERPDRAQRR